MTFSRNLCQVDLFFRREMEFAVFSPAAPSIPPPQKSPEDAQLELALIWSA
jgi:hypothetical protein